jgi:hypothetical protein
MFVKFGFGEGGLRDFLGGFVEDDGGLVLAHCLCLVFVFCLFF